MHTGTELAAEVSSLKEDLRRATDELQIRNLLANVYLMSDHDAALFAYAELFTEDAVWERVDGGGPGSHIGTRLEGMGPILADRRQLREGRRIGPDSGNHHLITTVSVTVGEDGTARALSKFLVVNASERRPIIDAVGHYDDAFRRTASGWKLCHRRYSSKSANH
jgi:SnoaL-like domain